MRRLTITAFVFAVIGVLSGVYYREITKLNDFTDRAGSQLGLVHTHFLTLGFLALLIALLLEKNFGLSEAAPKRFSVFYWTWTLGTAVTGAIMLVKGTIVVTGGDASSAAFAGIAGLGHTAVGVGLVCLFLALLAAQRQQESARIAR